MVKHHSGNISTMTRASRSRSCSRSPACVSLVLLLVVMMGWTVEGRRGAGSFLRDGMNSRYDYEDEDKFDDSDVDPTVKKMCDLDWTLPCLPMSRYDFVKGTGASTKQETVLANHVYDLLGDKPIRLKLNDKKAYRQGIALFRGVAVPGTAKSRKLRVLWRQRTNVGRLDTATLMEGRYEEAIHKLYPNSLEIELILPPPKGMKLTKLPCVVYTNLIGDGNINPEAVSMKARAKITAFYKGRTPPKLSDQDRGFPGADDGKSSAEEGSFHVGYDTVGLKIGAGIVDPMWARGRKFFWKGRPVGYL